MVLIKINNTKTKNRNQQLKHCYHVYTLCLDKLITQTYTHTQLKIFPTCTVNHVSPIAP